MKFYGEILQDMAKVKSNTDEMLSALFVVDKDKFGSAINDLELLIKNIKDKCNEDDI